jgi:hypothetical protein
VSNQGYAVQRNDERLPLPIPIVVNGVGKDGVGFSEPTETVNVSLAGMGLILKHEPNPNSNLRILILHRQNVFNLVAEVCHVTEQEGKRIVGVKFRKPMEFSRNS